MSIRDAARDVAVMKVIADLVKDGRDAAGATLRAEAEPGERISAKLPDGTVLGSVTLAKGRVSAKVVDERALFAWIEANRPDEIVHHQPTIRDSYLRHLLDQVKTTGAATTADGEVIPGLEATVGEPYPIVSLAEGAAEAVAAAWRSRVLELPGGRG